MLELIALAGLIIGGLAVACVVGVVFVVFKVVFWAVFLPFRLLFKLMWLPVGLVMGALSLAAGVTLLPILLFVGLIVAVLGAIAALVALAGSGDSIRSAWLDDLGDRAGRDRSELTTVN